MSTDRGSLRSLTEMSASAVYENYESLMLISTLAMNLKTKLADIDHGLELKRKIDHGTLVEIDEVDDELDM